jgi:subtilase family serine protease
MVCSHRSLCKTSVFAALLAATLTAPLYAAVFGPGQQPLITGKIDETHLVALPGNVRPEVQPANDRGPVGDSMQLNHLQLILQRSAASEAALDAYLQTAQTPGDPSYHQWLTADQIGQLYGPAPSDIAAVRDWLDAHGFQVNSVSATGMLIDFSGTAGQIASTFKTEIHALNVHGEQHFANVSDPQIPAALEPVIAGIASLNDFQPHPLVKPVNKNSGLSAVQRPSPAYTESSGYLAVVPADLATIYNFNPTYKSGIAGKGQSVVVLEDTDLYSNADVATFRSTFGLDSFKHGSFSVVHPGGCTDPGAQIPDNFEAAVDAEWATAAAPDANIVLASCADTTTNFGGFIALQSLLESRTPPAIVSLSYGECEAGLGASGNRYIATLYQIAAIEGISLYVGAGDSGAAGCDNPDTEAAAQYGISVSGYASTPYNLAAGGTDYSDVYSGTYADYWSPTNSVTYGSALSYIPEIPWNDSCAGSVVSSYLGLPTYGPESLCNIETTYDDIVAGGGGPSACAYGATNPNPNTPAVSGTCRGYAKPFWQQWVAGNPHDGVRDLPDVSMFASNGFWGHYYVVCYSDPAYKGVGFPCTGAPENWSGAGGTSFDAPILAGVQALVNQKTGFRQGNPDIVYYALAGLEYGRNGNPACNSNSGTNACIFHDVTFGDNVVDCTGTFNCYDGTKEYGVLSVSSRHDVPAYTAGTGWDFATGIGTVNVTALVNAWASIE